MPKDEPDLASFYDLLGVSRSATAEEIKRAFRARAVELHPDRHPGDLDKERAFKRVNAAYRVLGDPERRQKYDELISEFPDSTRTPPTSRHQAEQPRPEGRTRPRRRKGSRARTDEPRSRATMGGSREEEPQSSEARARPVATNAPKTHGTLTERVERGLGCAVHVVGFLIAGTLVRLAFRSCAADSRPTTLTVESPVREPVPTATTALKWVSAPSGVNLRTLPSTEARVSTMIPHGGRVEVLEGRKNGFVEVMYASADGRILAGWVAEEFLSDEMPTPIALAPNRVSDARASNQPSSAPREQARNAIARILPQARACLNSAQPGYKVRVTFDPDGSVQGVLATEGPQDQVAWGCIRYALAQTRIDAFDGVEPVSVDVTVP